MGRRVATYDNLKVSSLLQFFMGSQSIAKTIFLLISMAGWLIFGAALMYLFPFIADLLLSSDRTHIWMENLRGSGYNPMLAIVGGGIVLIINISAYFTWNQRFEDKIQ